MNIDPEGESILGALAGFDTATAAARLYGETYVGEGIIWTPKN